MEGVLSLDRRRAMTRRDSDRRIAETKEDSDGMCAVLEVEP